ncbi:hypothetical protein WR25_16123 [Diploscapter pachys]|uniref:Homeobox domain-containing protein n=1 Tax=Diploscapter pachys TaxID=2018661 RepID=A0A2A2LB24_9BILA|nr:hypothetical protein WR25_16123 [Diploscapter pachys]
MAYRFQLMPSNQSTTPIISEEGHSEAVRLLPGGSPLFGQFPFPGGLPQAAAMQAMAASAAASGLPYPAAVLFSGGMQSENRSDLLSLGGGPYPGLLFDSTGYHPYGGFDGVRRKNATRETTAPLKNWLTEHRKNPYPTKAEKLVLALMTKMTLTQVSTWFANARRRLKKENKMTWSPQNRRGDDDDDDLADIDAIDRPSSSTSGGSDRKDDSEISLASINNNLKGDNSPSKKLVGNKIWSIADQISPNASRVKDDDEKTSEAGSSKKEGQPAVEGLTPEQMQVIQQQMFATMAARFPQGFPTQFFAAMQGLRPPNGPAPPPFAMFNPLALMGLAAPANLTNGAAPSELAASSSPSPAPSSKNGSSTPSPNTANVNNANGAPQNPLATPTTSASAGAVNLSTSTH